MATGATIPRSRQGPAAIAGRRAAPRPRRAAPAARGTQGGGLIELQRKLGNQAVAKLLEGERTTVRRAPAGRASIYATIRLVRGGDVKGESKTPGYEGKVEALSVSFDPGRRPPGRTPGREPEAEPEKELTMTKKVDSTSQVLHRAALDADPVESATFEFVRTDDKGNTTTQLALSFRDGMVTSQQVSSGGDQPTESIGFSFRG